MQTLFGRLLCLLTILIPFDHRYDNWCRHFSLKLIPEGLILPLWYEKKIYVYGSDILSMFLFFLALYAFRIPLRHMLLERGVPWLIAFFFLSLCSIAASPLCSYPVAYFRLFQLLTPMLLFISVTAIGREWIRPVLWCFCIGGIIQAVLAIGQYFSQKPLGLFFLGELKALHQAGTIPTLNGSRWVFDHLFDSCIDVTFLRRASGTLNHSNLLASFLLVSIFSSFALFKTKTPARQLQILAICISLMIFALILTFSRSAFFGGIFGAFLYFYHIKSPSVLRWIAGISFVFSCILLSEQILQRGGIFNYNDFSSGSDAIRIAQNKVALKMFAAHPFLGVGYQQFTYTPEWNDFSAKEAIAMVHNSILLVAAETGLFAAICLMGFFFFILKSGWRTSSELEAAGLAIAAAFCLIANSDFYPFVCQPAKMALFLFLGLIPRTVRFCEFGGPAGPLNPVARPKGRLW